MSTVEDEVAMTPEPGREEALDRAKAAAAAAEDPIVAFEVGMRALRAPFPASAVGLLPRALSKGDQDRGECRQGTRYSADGRFCGGYHPRSIHLDYVGHAAVTDRLLQVDPRWNWEPVAKDEYGLPILDRSGGLWIRLTILGVTRLGYGDAPGKSNAWKELIGDALRNASMRFGVALDLWSKEDLRADEEERGTEDRPSDAAGRSGGFGGSRTASGSAEVSPASQAAAQPTSALKPIPEEIRAQWRQHILSREYLGNRPGKEPKDGGLRWAYADAKEAGILPYSIAPNDETTFLQLVQRLSAELPERPNEAGDEIPAGETPEARQEREIAEAEREAIAAHEREQADQQPMALGDDAPAGWGEPTEPTVGGAWNR